MGVSVGALPVLFEGSFGRSFSHSVRMQVTFPEFVGGGAALNKEEDKGSILQTTILNC